MRFIATVRRKIGKLFHAIVAGFRRVAAVETAAAGDLLQAGVEHSCPQAVLESLVEVADFPEFVLNPTVFDPTLKSDKSRGGRIIILQRFERSLSGEHAALDSKMNSLQSLGIEKAGRVAEDHPALARDGWNGPPPAVRQRLGSVANHLAAAEQAGCEWM